MNRLQFGSHFEETVKRAASRDDSTALKRAEFFLPQPEPKQKATVNAIMMAVTARRMEEVDAWVRREMAKHLSAEVCALPAAEFAQAVYQAGVYGKEVTFKDDAPGVARFALYGRAESGPDTLLATMTFDPVFDMDKTHDGEP